MQEIHGTAFMLVEDDKILAERRGLDRKVDPGLTVIPGGHVDEGETPEEAVVRELKEELNLTAKNIKFVCTLRQRSEENLIIHYFAIQAWEGTLQMNEAESLMKIPLDDLDALDLKVDRIAILEYLRDGEV